MNSDLSVIFSYKSLIIMILVMCRLGGMIATAPLFSTFPVPMQAKAALVALSAFIMYPFILQHSNFAVPTNLIMLFLMLFKELFIGILVGFCAQLIFIGIQIGGQLLSIQMGLAIAETLDPVTRQRTPVVGQLYLFTASMIFIFLNGHHQLFQSIYGSYSAIPIGINFDITNKLVENILYFTSQLFPIAFAVVMPIFGLLFITDIALAFVSKIMPQMNIFMVSLPLKIYIGLLCVALFMSTTAVYMTGLLSNMLKNLETIFI